MAASLRNVRLLSRTLLQASKAQNTTCCRSFSRFSRQSKKFSTFGTGVGVLTGLGASRAMLTFEDFKKKDPIRGMRDIEQTMTAAIELWKDDREQIDDSRRQFFTCIAILERLHDENSISDQVFNEKLGYIFTQLGDVSFYGSGRPLQAEKFYKRAMIYYKTAGVKKTDKRMLSLVGNIGCVCYTTERIDDGMKMLLFVKEKDGELAGTFKEVLQGFVETVPTIPADRIGELE